MSSKYTRISDKIIRCCAYAKANGYGYIWVDTCCIDKTSSAELSETINSMGEWYARADVCYAYLYDVDVEEKPREQGSRFRRNKWFTRGWTLQELVFPRRVVFLSCDWKILGTKGSLCRELEDITSITSDVLTGGRDLQSVSIAARMSWASRRQTTRLEDEAYCLLGIFGVHMSTIYGEGRNAFIRLQEEILKTTSDQSLFAWGPSAVLHAKDAPYNPNTTSSKTPSSSAQTVVATPRYLSPSTFRCLLASSPSVFANYAGIVPYLHLHQYRKHIRGWRPRLVDEYAITRRGFLARFPILFLGHLFVRCDCLIALLACQDVNGRLLGLVLSPTSERGGPDTYMTTPGGTQLLPSRQDPSSGLTLSIPSTYSPSIIRVILLDPSVLESWSPGRTRELYIDMAPPAPSLTEYRRSGVWYPADTISPGATRAYGILFPPWINQHVANWGFRFSGIAEHTTGVGIHQVDGAVLLSCPGDAFAVHLVREDGTEVSFLLFRADPEDLRLDGTQPEFPCGGLNVTMFGNRALPPGFTTRETEPLPLHERIRLLRFEGIENLDGVAVTADHKTRVRNWANNTRLLSLSPLMEGLWMKVVFWDSGSVDGKMRYTMDITISDSRAQLANEPQEPRPRRPGRRTLAKVLDFMLRLSRMAKFREKREGGKGDPLAV